MNISSLPRKTFDAVERPVATPPSRCSRRTPSWTRWRSPGSSQRSALRRVERGTAAAMRVVGVPTRADVVELVNQIGGLQRELRELRREVESR